MDNKIIVKTRFDHERIESSIIHKSGDLETVILEKIISLVDSSIREALIDLGWTPPPADNK